MVKLPSPKLFAELWPKMYDGYSTALCRVDSNVRPDDLPFQWEMELRDDYRLNQMQIDHREFKVRLHPLKFVQIQEAFVEADIVPVPRPEQIATIYAFCSFVLKTQTRPEVTSASTSSENTEAPVSRKGEAGKTR